MSDTKPAELAPARIATDPGAVAIWPPAADAEAPAAGPSVGRVLGRALPAVVIALLLGWLLSPVIGAIVLGLAALVAVLSLLSPPAARAIEHGLGRVAHYVGLVLTAVILTLLFVVVFVPVGLIGRLVRRDPLTAAHPHEGTSWLERFGWSRRRLPDRTYASEQDLQGRHTGRVIWGAGLAALLIVVDLVLGTVLVDPPAQGTPPPTEGGGGPQAIPALHGLAYVPQLFTEQFAAESGQYDPLLGWRLEDTDGQYLDIRDGERESYRTTAPGDPVVIWFFGGSAMYGFGQRDNHTIPSELVRLAEAEGVPIEAHNFGTPAYVNWQEVELFNRLITERPAPDLVVFYDGYNDLSQQLVDGPLTEPSHVLAAVQERQLQATPTEQSTAWEDVRDYWADHSATVNLYRRVRDRFGGGDEPEVRLTDAEASAVPDDVDPDAIVTAADGLLGRGRDLATAVAGAYGADVQFWFQPTLYSKGPVEGERHLLDRAANRTPAWEPVIEGVRADLPPDAVDLADALDGRPDPLFWDTVHTNETGARLIAAAAWPSLRAAITASGG